MRLTCPQSNIRSKKLVLISNLNKLRSKMKLDDDVNIRIIYLMHYSHTGEAKDKCPVIFMKLFSRKYCISKANFFC